MKKKIDINQVSCGMYVVELDRPWLETPFLFQGFEVSDDEDINQLKKHCHYVYIDTEQGTDVSPQADLGSWHLDKLAPEGALRARHVPIPELDQQNGSPAKKRPLRPDLTTLEEELGPAREAEQKTRHVIYSILEDVRLGKSIDTAGAKAAVGELTESIIRNPDALVCLTELKNKDEYTALHSLRVCILALAFGRHLGFEADALNTLGLGALLHDVGKIKVPVEILNKPTKLTSEEFEIMKSHVPEGVTILEAHAAGIPDIAIDIARFHHERYNGTGYALGKLGNQIGLFGKIGGVVDCYDAITSDRAYHTGMSSHDALKLLYEWRGTDFDPRLVEHFIQCMGIYPIGSLVEMNSGSIGVVVTINRTRRLKPKVVLVLTPDKQPHVPIKMVDLFTQSPDAKGGVLEIKRVLPSGTYGINPVDFLPIHPPSFSRSAPA